MRPIESFWGQDFGDSEEPPLSSSKKVMYVYGESLLPPSQDPDNPLFETNIDDWRGQNHLQGVVKSLDRIAGILGVINQSINDLGGAQSRIPFINHLADVIDRQEEHTQLYF